jgi:hypothetical protein
VSIRKYREMIETRFCLIGEFPPNRATWNLVKSDGNSTRVTGAETKAHSTLAQHTLQPPV